MDSKPLLNNEKGMRILIDSDSFIELIDGNDFNALRIMEYKKYHKNLLDFVRTPCQTDIYLLMIQ